MSTVYQHARIGILAARPFRLARVHSGIAQAHLLWRYFTSFVAQVCRLQLRRAPAGRVLNTCGMIALGDPYLDAARLSGRPLSVAVFEFEHLQEVGSIFGDRIRHALLAQVRARLAAAVGSAGAVAHTGPAQFTLLWPGLNRQAALDAIHREMGTPARVEFESPDDEIVLVPEFQVECAEDDGESIQALYRELCRELTEILQFQQRRQAHLTRERERYSCVA